MRVLAVGNMYPPHHFGGYELVWRSAVGHLRDSGHAVRILTTDFRRADAEGPEDPDVHRVLRWYWHNHAWPPLGVRDRVALERHNARTFDAHCAGFAPDVVTWWSMGGMSLSLVERARRARLPAVGFVHDDWLVYGPRVDQWLRTFERRPWLAGVAQRLTGVPTGLDASAAARWLFVSDDTRRRAQAGGAALDRTGIAHSGIDARHLDPQPEQPWRWRLLSVGRIDDRKGIDTAIAALAELPPEAQLTVVGDGDAGTLAALQALAAGLGVADRVTFAGARPPEALKRFYADADAVLFPVRWDEPWGLVPLEAMGYGRPVVASGRGGSAEYLRDGDNCLLVAADDAVALAAAVRRLAADPDLRARLRAGGARTAPQHTEAGFNAAVLAAIEDAARGTG